MSEQKSWVEEAYIKVDMRNLDNLGSVHVPDRWVSNNIERDFEYMAEGIIEHINRHEDVARATYVTKKVYECECGWETRPDDPDTIYADGIYFSEEYCYQKYRERMSEDQQSIEGCNSK